MTDLDLCAACGDPHSEHVAGIGACKAVWNDGKMCWCLEFMPRRGGKGRDEPVRDAGALPDERRAHPAPANPARPCVATDIEMLIDGKLFKTPPQPGVDAVAYRPKCGNCGWEVIHYVTESLAERRAANHLPLEAPGP
jgi:hypothetical protein